MKDHPLDSGSPNLPSSESVYDDLADALLARERPSLPRDHVESDIATTFVRYGEGGPLTPAERWKRGYVVRDSAAIRAAVRDLRDQLPRFQDDDEIMWIGVGLVAFHLEAGARTFKDCSQMLVADGGEKIVPYLRCFYVAASLMPGIGHFAESSASYVRGLSDDDVAAILGEPPSDHLKQYLTPEEEHA